MTYYKIIHVEGLAQVWRSKCVDGQLKFEFVKLGAFDQEQREWAENKGWVEYRGVV